MILTDAEFERTKRALETVRYVGFGFVDCDKRAAIGMVQHTRLGATFHYIQTGTIENPSWRQTDYDGYFEHCKAI